MTPIHFLNLEMLGFLYALAGIVAYRLFTRRINLAGLFLQKDGTGQVSAGRVQLLLATIAMSADYLNQVATTTNGKMPDVSPNWLYLFGSSSGVYVFEKALNAWNQYRRQDS